MYLSESQIFKKTAGLSINKLVQEQLLLGPITINTTTTTTHLNLIKIHFLVVSFLLLGFFSSRLSRECLMLAVRRDPMKTTCVDISRERNRNKQSKVRNPTSSLHSDWPGTTPVIVINSCDTNTIGLLITLLFYSSKY